MPAKIQTHNSWWKRIQNGLPPCRQAAPALCGDNFSYPRLLDFRQLTCLRRNSRREPFAQHWRLDRRLSSPLHRRFERSRWEKI